MEFPLDSRLFTLIEERFGKRSGTILLAIVAVALGVLGLKAIYDFAVLPISRVGKWLLDRDIELSLGIAPVIIAVVLTVGGALATLWASIVLVHLTARGARWSWHKLAGQPQPADSPKLAVAQTFRNRTITLDHHRYVDCVFIDCTLRWDGGPFAVARARTEGMTRLETQNSTVVETIDLLKALGWLREDFAESWQHEPAEYFET